MVKKYKSPIRIYKHPFELVMAVSILRLMSWLIEFIIIDDVLFSMKVSLTRDFVVFRNNRLMSAVFLFVTWFLF